MKYTPELMHLDTLYRRRRNPLSSRWNVVWAAATPGALPPADGQAPDDQLTRELQQEVEEQLDDDEPAPDGPFEDVEDDEDLDTNPIYQTEGV